jgi:hypothetical protein
MPTLMNIRAFQAKYPLLSCGVLLCSLWLVGAVGYVLIEHYPIFDAVYMALITISTVGYGEIHPLSFDGRLFTTGLIASDGAIIGFTVFSLVRFVAERVAAIHGPVASVAGIREQVTTLLDSEHFLTVLRTALPIGTNDQEYGFDFIPFMLHRIDERRRTFKKSARNFLILTVVLGCLFSGVVFYFGYILVNEAAAGPGRIIAELGDNVRDIRTKITLLTPNLAANTDYQHSAIPGIIEKLRTEARLPPELKEVLNKGITDSTDLFRLQTLLQRAGQQSSTSPVPLIGQLLEQLERFTTVQTEAAAGVMARLNDLDALQHAVNDALQRPENRTADILKRIAVGFIVTSFLLAILRYVGGLYRDQYRQVLVAEQDDLGVRRFYVAYKCAKDNTDERKQVLGVFVGGTVGSPAPETGMVPGMPSQEIIKELLGILAKKL